MSYAPPAPPARQDTGFTARPGFRKVKWLVAVPAHLTMACSVFVGCASAVGLVDLTGGPAPGPGEFTAAPDPGDFTTTPELTASAAVHALEGLTVAARGPMSDYDRAARFGDWIDADEDCVDTRNEILDRDLAAVEAEGSCTVASGILEDPYTGTTIHFTRGVATSSMVQIDHVVSVGNAWVSGARELSQAERVQFYNDPLNLLAVDGRANAAKSDSAADEWLPPEESFRCEYVATQIAVKAKYDLWVTFPEKEAMADVLATCPGQDLPVRAAPGGTTGGVADADRASTTQRATTGTRS